MFQSSVYIGRLDLVFVMVCIVLHFRIMQGQLVNLSSKNEDRQREGSLLTLATGGWAHINHIADIDEYCSIQYPVLLSISHRLLQEK